MREKDGRKLSLLYQSSTNSVRQAAQALIKQWWEELGVAVELRNIDAGVFFGADPGSPDTLQKFYADVEMYANKFDGTDPEKYLSEWVCDPSSAARTQWQGGNYLALVQQGLRRAASPSWPRPPAPRNARQDHRSGLNDMIVNSPSFIGLVAPRPAVGEVEHARRRHR